MSQQTNKSVLLVANTGWYLYRFRIPLAKKLQAQGFNPIFICPADEHSAQLQKMGFKWLEWNIGRRSLNPLAELLAIFKLYHIYKAQQPAIIHHFTIKPVIYGSIAAKLARLTHVINSITSRGYVYLNRSLKARFIRMLTSTAYRCLLNSGYTVFENPIDQSFFVSSRFSNPRKSITIYGNGVDTEKFKPLPEPTGEIIVLFASRFLKDKGILTFIDAARQLQNEPLCQFVLVGAPDLGNLSSVSEAEVNSWVKAGIVQWWGWDNDIRNSFAKSHIFVLPSLGEGIANILMEASACERAIITSTAQGCKDIIEHEINGLLIPPQNTASLVSAIRRLITDPPLRERLRKEARQKVFGRFDTETVNTQTIELYRKILQETP